MHPSHPGISLVIPVYNEIENIELLEHAIITNLVGHNYEVIFVNDGSTVRIKECCFRHNNFRALHFKRHAVQTAAMDAGFKHACGKYIVSMNADMQNDPTDIPKLLEKFIRMIWYVVGGKKGKIPGSSAFLPSLLILQEIKFHRRTSKIRVLP